MSSKKNRMVWAALPLYVFTILFVVGPMLYMVALSFARNRSGYGVDWTIMVRFFDRYIFRRLDNLFSLQFQVL